MVEERREFRDRNKEHLREGWGGGGGTDINQKNSTSPKFEGN